MATKLLLSHAAIYIGLGRITKDAPRTEFIQKNYHISLLAFFFKTFVFSSFIFRDG
jgi:hypothetical protein